MNVHITLGSSYQPRRMAAVGLLFAASVGCSFTWAQAPAPTPAPATRNVAEITLGPSCVTSECHSGYSKQPFLHGPVNLGQCTPCHTPTGPKHVFQPMAKDRKQLCQTCHQIEAPKKVVHAPFNSDCTHCHDPHGGENRFFVKGGTGSESCKTCHGDLSQRFKVMHGPVAGGECVVCHSPHQSDFEGLLLEDKATLCQSCHTDVQESLKGAVSVHAPMSQDCTGCHGAHGGEERYFLVAQGEELCRKCHGDFLKKLDEVKFPHKVMSEGKGCANCHKPHASDQQGLLASANMDLCLSCHNQTIKSAKRTIANIQKEVEGSKSLHGPLREKNCIACHAAHGSEHPKILSDAFPAAFYSKFTEDAYNMCFKCHDRQIVEQEKSTVTNFRNGDVNLHYLHTHRDKGRSCRACHAEHGSDQPKHIRSSVPFGNWQMEIKYMETPDGGGCNTGCHLPYKYDRKTAVANKQAGP